MTRNAPVTAENPADVPWQARSRSVLLDKRILIVEDEPIVAIDYRFQLMGMGAKPAALRSTNQAALDFLATHEVDAAIVDYRLRDGSSSEPVMCWLRDHGIPFIVISGNTPEMHQWTGAVCVLDKPVTHHELWAALSEALP